MREGGGNETGSDFDTLSFSEDFDGNWNVENLDKDLKNLLNDSNGKEGGDIENSESF